MKKLVGIVMAIVMMLGVVPVMASENVEEGYTYKVTFDETSEYQAGTIMLVDENHDVNDFVVVTDSSYGYIYIPINSGYNVEMYDVKVEKVADKDLGVSGSHVYVMKGYRTYDKVLDTEIPAYIEDNPQSVDFE